jgi:hypothetical protein
MTANIMSQSFQKEIAMKRLTRLFSVALLFSFLACASAADYAVRALNEPPPADKLSKEIGGQLAATGVRVTRGDSPFCDVWLAKSWPSVSEFKSTPEIAYPFVPGQLIGVARFARKSADFRDQDINTGIYTMRYAQQPVDGAHVGTSLTRDFLLLIEAAKDKTPALLEYKQLTKASAEAAGSSHPALLSLQKPATESKESPSIRHDEERDWWIVGFQGQLQGKEKAAAFPVELVIVGHATE